MYWADKVAKEIISSGNFRPYWVDDMKTPSGFAHIGSLRGPLIHSVIFQALKDANQKAKFTFVFNDFDHADELPPEFKEKLIQYMGCPLREIPSPVEGFGSLGAYLVNDLKETLLKLGIEADYLSSYDLYKAGKFDGVIREALDNSEKIQDIYEKVSGSKKRQQGWLPFQVVCEKCGKLGTTRVFAWDGKEVCYKCEPTMVTWAKGCGHEGKISPFRGTGKLPWKVDWPAHWKIIGVTIEGAGKDHASAGGSYDIAMEMVKDVFKYPQPYKYPYEFILIGGRKMSSSKGLGLKAHDIVKILPPEVARFLFTRTNPKEQINFDPLGSMAIPDLFDEYDSCWQAYIDGGNENLARAFELAQIKDSPKKESINLPRFRDVANMIVQGKKDLPGKFEQKVLEERIKYAKIWLEKYAPDDFNLSMSIGIPVEVKNLDEEQKKYLAAVINLVEKFDNETELQGGVYSLAKELKVDIKKAFAAIYISFIGKDHGPRAGQFLLSYPKEKVINRLKEVSK